MKELSNEDVKKYMEMAVEVMKDSIQEPRKDKVSPKVGAVLIKPDGEVETAFRGELRHGDHAEFSLLERKNRAVPLDGSLLFATLEPCTPGARKHPKLGCAERIVNARIKKVWIGIEDPDPSVDRKGIKYLQEHGIEIEMFPPALQKIIRQENKQFLVEAEERAKQAEVTIKKTIVLSDKEQNIPLARLDSLDKNQVDRFINMARLNSVFGSDLFISQFLQLGLLMEVSGKYNPTGYGLLLFGERPQLSFQNAVINATFKTEGRGEEVQKFEGSLPSQIDQIQSWYETRIGSQIDRSKAERETTYDYPRAVFREAIINAVAHRDYDIEGAPIYFEINDDAIIVKSPGHPVDPISVDQIREFNAPSLSRNPKIMYVFYQLKLVEQRGLGFETVKRLPSMGIPLPIVDFHNPYLTFTFPRSVQALRRIKGGDIHKELNDEEINGVDFFQIKKQATRKEYQDEFSIDTKKAERQLKKLVELKLIERKGSGPGTYYEIIET